MKRLCLSFLFLLSILSSYACYSEYPSKVTKIDGIVYAYDEDLCEWYVAGFEQDQDSVVLKHKVTIDGKIVNVKLINVWRTECIKAPGSPRVLVIDKGFEEISYLALPRLEKLYIPRTIIRTHERCVSISANISSDNLKEIIVDKRNKNLKSVDGVLFSKDGKILLLYPSKKECEEYTIPSETQSIICGAFAGCELKKFYYSKSKKNITDYDYWEMGDNESIIDCMGFDVSPTKFIGK